MITIYVDGRKFSGKRPLVEKVVKALTASGFNLEMTITGAVLTSPNEKGADK